MNTTTIHLANAHPDYPGVSEMYDKKETAADQRYMSVEEFVDNFYIPLPSKQDVLQAMQYDLPIRRERAWVGPWPQQQGL